jgi:hypothetical protein
MLTISPRPGSKSFWIGCLRVAEVPGRKILKLLGFGAGLLRPLERDGRD